MSDWIGSACAPLVMWLVTAASILGAVANAYRKRWGFGVWAVTNACWVAYDISIHAYAQAALFAVYFAVAIVGLWKWRKA